MTDKRRPEQRVLDLGLVGDFTNADVIHAIEKSQAQFALLGASVARMAEVLQQGSFAYARLAQDNSEFLRQVSLIDRLHKAVELATLNPPWFDAIAGMRESIDRFSAGQLIIQDSLTRFAGLTSAMQASLSAFQSRDFAGLLVLDSDVRMRLEQGFQGLTDWYSRYLRSIEILPQSFTILPPEIAERPAVGMYLSVDLARSLTVPVSEVEQLTEIRETTEDIAADDDSWLYDELSRLDPELWNPWAGAIAALSSDNPDKVRHFSVSSRELLREVMHRLAPDEVVKAWTSNPADFHKGRYTREARLRYIHRNVAHGPFEAFIEKEIETTLAFRDLFERGTHPLTSGFTDEQIHLMRWKMASVLVTLLLVAEQSDT